MLTEITVHPAECHEHLKPSILPFALLRLPHAHSTTVRFYADHPLPAAFYSIFYEITGLPRARIDLKSYWTPCGTDVFLAPQWRSGPVVRLDVNSQKAAEG